MHYLPANAQHIGAREYQQDSFGFANPGDESFLEHGGFLAVLCDGMGGMAHGDLASQTAVRSILDAYARKSPDEAIPDALERSVREANQQVFEAAHELGKAEGVGTTVVAAVLHQEALYFASVGDSGLFLLSGGQIQMVNQPHVYANVLDRAVATGVISREMADQHPERESLTSFVGIQTLEEIDRNTEPWPVRAGDTVILASDGMFKTLEAHEILAALEGNPRAWPQVLVDRVLEKERPGQDNVTVLSVTLDPLGMWQQEIQTPSSARSLFSDSAGAALPLQGTPGAKQSSPFLLITLLLLILALAIGGLWYFYSVRGSPRFN